MKQIPVGQTFAVVDDQDESLVSGFHWRVHKAGYAVTTVGPKRGRTALYMHSLVLKAPAGKVTDHRDNTKRLDNRRQNLRLATHSQNHGNTRYKPDSASHFRGVAWHKAAGKWRARIADGKYANGRPRNKHLGLFMSEIEAAHAYDAAALEYFGEFATLNFKVDQSLGVYNHCAGELRV